jgi:hypothetical protein
MSDEFSHEPTELRVMVDGQAVEGWIGGEQSFVVTSEAWIAYQADAQKVTETFRKFFEDVARIANQIIHDLETSGLFDLDWEAINTSIEKSEKSHERRFSMYQRRYARGKKCQ